MSNWENLYEENGSALVLYAMQFVSSRSVAEDVVHDAFVKIFQKENLHSHANLKALLFRSVRWTALDRIKKDTRRQERELHADPLFVSPVETSSPGQDDFAATISRLLQNLPDQQREVLVLHVWGDLTFREIGEQLEISANTAASRYRYGLEKLRESTDELNDVRFPNTPLTVD